jgi:hypothetical protein
MIKRHPKPPFAAQQQPMPGLTAEMKAVPDHGEKSYIGYGRLKDKKAIITGGDSGIGRAVSIAYAREGADILIAYRRRSDYDDHRRSATYRDDGDENRMSR